MEHFDACLKLWFQSETAVSVALKNIFSSEKVRRLWYISTLAWNRGFRVSDFWQSKHRKISDRSETYLVKKFDACEEIRRFIVYAAFVTCAYIFSCVASATAINSHLRHIHRFTISTFVKKFDACEGIRRFGKPRFQCVSGTSEVQKSDRLSDIWQGWSVEKSGPISYRTCEKVRRLWRNSTHWKTAVSLWNRDLQSANFFTHVRNMTGLKCRKISDRSVTDQWSKKLIKKTIEFKIKSDSKSDPSS